MSKRISKRNQETVDLFKIVDIQKTHNIGNLAKLLSDLDDEGWELMSSHCLYGKDIVLPTERYIFRRYEDNDEYSVFYK